MMQSGINNGHIIEMKYQKMISRVKGKMEVVKLTCATYPRAVADFCISFLSVKKLIFLKDSIVNCRPRIVKDP